MFPVLLPQHMMQKASLKLIKTSSKADRLLIDASLRNFELSRAS
jgi:hypothetical protein